MEEDIQKQIIAAKEEAHDETIWGNLQMILLLELAIIQE